MSPHSIYSQEEDVALANKIPGFQDLADHDIIVIPSISVSYYEIRGISLVHEERHLVLMDLLKNKNSRMIFIFSTEIPQEIIDYRLSLISAENAKDRLTILHTNDHSQRPLIDKILEQDDLMNQVSGLIRDKKKTVMMSYTCSEQEEKLKNKLKINKWMGSSPCNWGTKSGSRTAFARGNVPVARGTNEAMYTVDELITAIVKLVSSDITSMNKVIIKIDDGSGGYGNTVLDVSKIKHDLSEKTVEEGLKKEIKYRDWDTFCSQIRDCGVIVEQWIDFKEGAIQTLPSAQVVVYGEHEVRVLSSHEQVIDGVIYQGCCYPAEPQYMERILEYANSVGKILASEGVRGFFGIDFLATKEPDCDEWDVIALEINLRMCATTYAFFQLLTALKDESHASKKHYISMDEAPIIPLNMKELLKITKDNNLHFNKDTECGIVYNLMGNIEKGEVGVTCIGDTKQQSQKLLDTFRSLVGSKLPHVPVHGVAAN